MSTSGFPTNLSGLASLTTLTDYQPLINTFDRYLAGWKTRLLSTGGRLTLVRAVLNNLPVYYMSSLALPKNLCEILESKRRAFL